MGTAEEDYGVDTLKITDDDAAFILGKGGKTKVPCGVNVILLLTSFDKARIQAKWGGVGTRFG
jgi:hypothetical protein